MLRYLETMRKYTMVLKRIYRTKKPYLYLIVVTVLFSWLACYVRDKQVRDIIVKDINNTFKMLQEDLVNSLIEYKGKGCEIPHLDPFDEGAMKFVSTLPDVVCAGHDWVECYMDECYIVKRLLQIMKTVHCTFSDIIYVTDKEYKTGPPHTISRHETYKLTKSDHVVVYCSGTMSNSSHVFHWVGRRVGFRRLPVTAPRPSTCPRLNVLMLCFASTSKNGFIRKMPKSLKTLKKLGALFFNGYNVVGDGTTAALFPILTGKSELEFPEIRRMFTKDYLDEKLFIFHPLSKLGYRTAFFEDSPFLGTFQNRFNGFKVQPADHYLLPLLQEEFADYSRSNSMAYCLGHTPLYSVLLNLTYQFHQLTGNRFSFTFITDICRDNFNQISTADDDLARFLKRMQQGGRMKETVLFVMGDHGTRFSPVRETVQGRLEERLPFMAIIPPEVLIRTRPEALKAMRVNQNVLVTPYDIHSTLTDILAIGEKRNKYTVPGADTPRGMTLLQPIPATRTCGEAGVLPHWCSCALWKPVSPRSPLYEQIAAVLADYIDNLTAEWRSLCAPRSLKSIESVSQQTANDKVLKYKKSLDVDGYLGKFGEKIKPSSVYYQAKIIMDPGQAVFEGSLRYFVERDYFAISESDISRLNSYTNESACVGRKPHLNKYCYCKS